jgi:hypothetical protein
MKNQYRCEESTVPPDRFDSLLGYGGDVQSPSPIKPDMIPGDPCFILYNKEGHPIDAFSTKAEAWELIESGERTERLYARCKELALPLIEQLSREFNVGSQAFPIQAERKKAGLEYYDLELTRDTVCSFFARVFESHRDDAREKATSVSF